MLNADVVGELPKCITQVSFERKVCMAASMSVAMATYNGASFLREQLSSLASQTRLPDELIVSDDNSSDNTLEVLTEFAREAPFPVRIITNSSRVGYAANFNRALLGTTGSLVLLCDQDDFWFPYKLQRLEEIAAAESDAMVIMNDVEIADGELLSTGITKLTQFVSIGAPLSDYVMGAAAAIRREYLDALLPIPEDFPAHDDWLIKPAIHMKRRRIVMEPLQTYRIHGNNTSLILVNSVSRVSRNDVCRRRARKLKDGKLNDVTEKDMSLLNLRIIGLEAAANRSKSILGDEFKMEGRRLEGIRSVAAMRKSVQARPRWQRLPGVLRLWRQGLYEEFGGRRSAIVDLVVRPE